MVNAIIPGFAVTEKLFEEFLIEFGSAVFVSLPDNSYKQFDKKLIELTEKYKKINLFAWSMGTLFSLKWTIENPGIINSLFLTGATARFCEREGYKNGISYKKLDQMKRLVKKRPELVMNDFYSSVTENVDNKEKYFSILKENMPDIDSLYNGLDQLSKIDLLSEAERIKIPVYILHGNADRITPLEGARILNELLDNSVLLEINGGHSIFLENKKLCSSVWKKFLCTVE